MKLDNINNNRNRFLANNIKFFNLFYNRKSINIKLKIKYINKNIYFYNIIIFINKIKNIIKIKEVKLI